MLVDLTDSNPYPVHRIQTVLSVESMFLLTYYIRPDPCLFVTPHCLKAFFPRRDLLPRSAFSAEVDCKECGLGLYLFWQLVVIARGVYGPFDCPSPYHPGVYISPASEGGRAIQG